MAEPDAEGRTPLHYAAMSGNHSILYSLKYKLDNNLFKIRDNNGMTVLDTLFEHMSTITPIENNYILILPHLCPMSAIFELMECSSERVQILDSFEYFVYKIFRETVNVSISTQRDIFLYMKTAINKNRIYTLALLKHFHPRLYKNAIIQNGSYFFGLITKGLIILSPLLRPLILNDIVTMFINNNQSGINMSEMLIDKHRKYWTLFTEFNPVDSLFLNNTLNNFPKLPTKKDLLTSITYGGNIAALKYIKPDNNTILNLTYYIDIAPCLSSQLVNFRGKLNVIYYIPFKKEWVVQMVYSNPYSHVFFVENLKSIYWPSSYDEFLLKEVELCNIGSELNFLHKMYAKGFIKLVEMLPEKLKLLKASCMNQLSVTPVHLGVFFNHFTMYGGNTLFLDQKYVALLFKIVLDYKSFVFPKESMAWQCNKIKNTKNRKISQKLHCLKELEKDVLNFLTVICKLKNEQCKEIFKIKDILNFVKPMTWYDNEFLKPMTWYDKEILKQIRKLKKLRYAYKVPSYNDLFSKTFKKINSLNCLCSNCKNSFSTGKSMLCLKYISVLNKINIRISSKIQACLQMIFPLSYLIYHETVYILPNLANRNTVDNVKVMIAYASVPNFHNSPIFKYWDVLRSQFNDPFREMTTTILSSSTTEILKWGTVRATTKDGFSFDKPLTAYDEILGGDQK